MPARLSRPARCASCSTPRSIPTPRRCLARCRSSAARRSCSPSRASRPISPPCRRAALSKNRQRYKSVARGRRGAGSPSHKSSIPQRKSMPPPLLEIEGLTKHFPVTTALFPRKKTAWVKAVDGIDFAVGTGETLGVIGESGCGKTTTSKLILLQETPTAGAIRFDGQDIAEPLQIHTGLSRDEQHDRVAEVLDLVGLRPEVAQLFPHEFSGGQRQRIAIARALVTNTRLIVLDEPVSALDVSIRAQIMNQLEELQQRLGVSYLFIGHDLATVAHISHRIAVMYLGQIVELAEAMELCRQPLHPYTQALFTAALPAHPDEKRERLTIAGEVPSALDPPSGCCFHPRCPQAMARCSVEAPIRKEVAPGHTVACHLY